MIDDSEKCGNGWWNLELQSSHVIQNKNHGTKASFLALCKKKTTTTLRRGCRVLGRGSN